jgi:predicted small secreted protein
MKLARIVSIVFAVLAVSLAGCQTDGAGSTSSGTTSSSGSSGGY